MTLFEFIKSQGIPDDAAMDFVLAKKNQPRLAMTTYKGKCVNLNLPGPSDGVKFNQMIDRERFRPPADFVPPKKSRDVSPRFSCNN